MYSDEGLEAMASAVERADCLICACSPGYQESQLCRAAAEYAYNSRKAIIPVTVQRDFRSSGWLGALCGASVSLDVYDKRSMVASCTLIAEQVSSLLDTQAAPADSGAVASQASAAQWTEADVQAWLRSLDVSAAVGSHWAELGIDGRALVGLKALTQDNSLYHTLTHELRVVQPAERLRIVAALETISTA